MFGGKLVVVKLLTLSSKSQVLAQSHTNKYYTDYLNMPKVIFENN